MKFSYFWLKELVQFDQSPQEIADILTMIGHEVDSTLFLGEQIAGIVTGKINTITPHPNADKLVITHVDIGTEVLQIVTGATNINSGDIVPVSPVGARLANGTVIKACQLRGENSSGMLCSESELGVSESSDGIWTLPSDTPIGINFIDKAFLNDVIYDIAILPNRGDCQSHIGLARDLAAYFRIQINLPQLYDDTDLKPSTLSLVNHVKECVSNYTARRIDNIKFSITPLWMQQRLRYCGIRPINIVVDITNYILLEFGQPLHAFDSQMIVNDSISIDYSKNDQKFSFLDNDTLPLTQTDIVICTNNDPIALGGIMGGTNSQVTAETEAIVLESAHFNAVSIRKTAKRLVKRTESAIRFEKGVDVAGVITASKRAAYLYHLLTQATIYSLEQTSLDSSDDQKILPYSPHDINVLLGTDYPSLEIDSILISLGFLINTETITVPTWRHHDINSIPCIAEEVARIAGIDSIPTTLPQQGIVQDVEDSLVKLQDKLRPFLTSLGFNETVTYPMVSEQDCQLIHFDPQQQLAILNPLSIDESFMRPLLLPSLLKTLSYNFLRQNTDLKLFEIGKIFGKQISDEALNLGGIFSGKWNVNSLDNNQLSHFSHVMQILSNLSEFVKIKFEYNESELPFFHPIESLLILLNKKVIGSVGMIHPNLTKAYKISDPVYYFDISLTHIHSKCFLPTLFKPFSRYPSIRRDIAVIIPKRFSYADIIAVFDKFKPKLVTHFYLFDLFESADIGNDNKSMAFAFIYQDLNKTLSDDKVNRSHNNFLKIIKEKLPITIR